MNTKNPTASNSTPQESYNFSKRIGSTTFQVAVHFNPSAKETAQDKILRLIRNEAAMGEYGEATLRKAANL